MKTMAKQTIRIFSNDDNPVVLFEHKQKFPKIADSVADVWKMTNGLLFAKFNCGGSFGNERHIALYTERYVIDFITER